MITFTLAGGSTLVCKGGARNLIVFPSSDVPRSEKDIVLASAPEEASAGDVISWPGEYDRDGMSIRGVGQLEGQQVSYVVELDGVRCAFLSSPLKEWSDHELGFLGDVDVLALPAEEPKVAQALVEEIDPRVLFLLPGKDGKMHPEVLKSCGAQGKEQVAEYKLKGALPVEGREVVVLKKE